VTSSVGLQVVDFANPAAPTLITTIDFTTLGFPDTDLSSVAVKNGVVAVAIPTADKLGGRVVFLNAADNALLGSAIVGALPDNVVFTPDGTKVLTANEGEYTGDGSAGDPTTVGGKGSVSIIDISGGFGAPLPVQTAGFTQFDGQEAALRADGVRIFQGVSVSDDIEPEYIAISPDGTKAMVTLQEANAVGLLDIATATFTDIVPLGLKDFSTLLADFSDRDGPGGTTSIKLETGNPVFGLYMPDAIDSYSFNGQTYYVMANEGDDRNDFLNPDEVIRLKDAVNLPDYVLAPDVFPNAASLLTDAELGRLNVVVTPGLRGDTDGDGQIEQILALGGRSFSILDADGNRVFDSADIIERIVAEFGLVANNTSPGFDDTRSDNKGPEPEGIEIAEIGGRTYALVGLERSHMTLAFDVTDPTDVTYTGAAVRDGDLNPEGTLFISAADSPTGVALYVASNEESNNISVFEIEEAPPVVDYTLQILHASDWEAGIQAVERAPNFAAIIDAFEDEYANSITLLSGDNFIPGPFTAAGTDPSVRDDIASFYETLFGLDPGSLVGIRNGTLPFNALDIAIANAMGVQASVLGNHEFDLGTNALTAAINSTIGTFPPPPAPGGVPNTVTNVGTLFPYLSANVLPGTSELTSVFTPNLLPATEFGLRASDFNPTNGTLSNPAGANRPQYAPWTTIEEGGETIGVLGITTQILAQISNLGNAVVADPAGDGGVDNMVELAGILQPLVNQMEASGIDKIILLAHLQQIGNERLLATLLNGVDIILGGGSNTIFADENDVLEPGDVAGGTYPEFYDSADGTHKVALINTDGNYHYVGRLVIGFDENGFIIPGSVDSTVSGAYVTTEAGVDAVAGDGDGVLDQAERDAIFADGTRALEVQKLANAAGDVIDVKDGVVVGFTDVFLEGRRNFVRSEETNLGNLTAEANLAVAKATDLTTIISIKNGGGIRAEIGVIDPATGTGLPPVANPDAGKPEGGISQLDIENSLRFNNTLALITLTAQGLLNAIENAIRGANPGATPGAFPQIAGLSFSWDDGRPPLDRVVSLVVTNQQGEIVDVIADNGSIVGDPTREFRLVTLGFLAPAPGSPTTFGDNIFVRGTGPITETSPGVVGGTLAVYTDFADLDRVDLAGSGATFDTPGSEQRALADYLSALHGTPDTAFDEPETPRADDERIQNLDFRPDTVNPDGAAAETTDANDDLVVGNSLNNTVFSGAGNDTVYGGDGDDSLVGGARNDQLFGGDGNDTLIGGAGDDTVFGGDGDDRIVDRGGNDVMTGGDGADLFVIKLGAAGNDDEITDFTIGEDRISIKEFNFADFAAVQAASVDTADGVEIMLGSQTLLLAGVMAAQLSAGDFIL
jgi:2',3'-cyclic-nucleotide 2'-phosphodiesterase (5'-nucleotidase family)/DNA-binding beta-propeller fold protein YncE